MANVTLHYMRTDGTVGSETIEASEGGGYVWKVPPDFAGIIAGGGGYGPGISSGSA